MNRLLLSIMLLILGLVVSPFSAGRNNIGIDYLPDAASVVFGGSNYSFQLNNRNELRTLYLRRIGASADAVLYRSSEGGLINVQASPQGRFVGVLERGWEENVSPDRANFVDRRADKEGNMVEFYYLDISRLLILDLDGEIQQTVDEVRRYAWDPNSQRIIYTTGDYNEDSPFAYSTSGTWLYDLSSRQSQLIYDKGMEVEWASWDGNIYIYEPIIEDMSDTQVLRFNPDSGELSATTYKDINFSPDGEFYFVQGYDHNPVMVYRTQDDELVVPNFSFESEERTRNAGYARGWLNDTTLIVPSPNPGEEGDYLINIETGTRRYAPGSVLGIPDNNAQGLMIDEASTFRFFNEAELETLLP